MYDSMKEILSLCWHNFARSMEGNHDRDLSQWANFLSFSIILFLYSEFSYSSLHSWRNNARYSIHIVHFTKIYGALQFYKLKIKYKYDSSANAVDGKLRLLRQQKTSFNDHQDKLFFLHFFRPQSAFLNYVSHFPHPFIYTLLIFKEND